MPKRWIPRGGGTPRPGPLASRLQHQNHQRNSNLGLNIRLNKELGNTRGIENILLLVERDWKQYNIVNCVTALRLLAKQGGASTREHGNFKHRSEVTAHSKVSLLLQHTESLINGVEPRHVSSILWACAKLNLKFSDSLVLAALKEAMILYRQFNEQETSVVVWSIAKISSKGRVENTQKELPEIYSLTIDICQSKMDRFHNFTSQGISNICWGLGTIFGGKSEKKMHKVCNSLMKCIQDKMPTFNYQEVSNTIWAFAKLEVLISKSFAKTILEGVMTRKMGFSSQHLANVAWGMSHIKERSANNTASWDIQELLFHEISRRSHEFNVQELSMVAWAVAVSSSTDADDVDGDNTSTNTGEDVMKMIQEKAMKARSLFNSQQVSGILWAAGRMRVAREGFLETFADILPEKFEDIKTGQDIDSIIWAYARLDVAIPSLLRSIVTATIRCLQDSAGSSFSPKNLSNVIWGLGKLKANNTDDLIVLMARIMTRRVNEFNPRDLSNAAWGFANLATNKKLTQLKMKEIVKELFLRIGEASQECIDDFSAQECSKLLWAFDKVKVTHRGFTDAATTARRTSYKFEGLKRKIVLENIVGGGRKLSSNREETGATAATGGALWEASFVLADWINRHLGSEIPENESPSAQDLLAGFSLRKGRAGVELGAGLGLASIVAKKRCKIKIIATDGDKDVLNLLQKNCDLNGSKVRVQHLTWGMKDAFGKLKLKKKPSILFGSGIIYGKDEEVWKKLAKTIVELSGQDTKVLLAHGQGAAPGVHDAKGPFFKLIRKTFTVHKIPQTSLHSDHRNGSCVIHLLIPIRTEGEVVLNNIAVEKNPQYDEKKKKKKKKKSGLKRKRKKEINDASAGKKRKQNKSEK